MGRAGIKEDTIDEENVEKAGAVKYCLFLFALLFYCRLNVGGRSHDSRLEMF